MTTDKELLALAEALDAEAEKHAAESTEFNMEGVGKAEGKWEAADRIRALATQAQPQAQEAGR